jgi:SAM-dependent methyltransferase
MRITHANVWKRKPYKKSSFNSDEVHLSFSHLKKIKRVLDVACGNGLGVSLPLLRKGYEVYSFDKWKAAIAALIKNAKGEGYRSKVKTGDMYKKFPYKSSFFDASFCFQAIYHGTLSQIENTLKEIKRVTKKDGYFFGTFLPYYIKNEKDRYYFNYTMKNGGIGRIYVKPDKKDKYLCYNLAKKCEFMVPHYHFTKNNLKNILNKYFNNKYIKKIIRPDKNINVWFVRCKI